MKHVIFWFRMTLVFLGVAIASTLGLIYCLLRWGHLDNNFVVGRMVAMGSLPFFGVKVKSLGQENLVVHQPCIYVANHQSGMDLPLMAAFCPRRVVAVGKKEIIWLPFFGILFAAAGNLLIDRSNRVRAMAELDEAVEKIKKRKASIFLFPEGTRNRSKDLLLPFKKGAFHLAIKGQIPIVPLVISPVIEVIDWYGRKMYGGVVTIKALPPVFTQGMQPSDVMNLSNAVREKMIQGLKEISKPREV
jgi:1-acyl-sn-glycerol-3-phosphate acyltransferase